MNNFVGKFKEFIGFEENEETMEISENVEINNTMIKPKNGKVVNLNSAATTKVLISKPKTYDDAKDISEAIKDKKIVTINTIGLDAKVAQRLVDFVSGACYVLGASVQELESRIYLVSPNNAEIISDAKTEMVEKSFFNWNKNED